MPMTTAAQTSHGFRHALIVDDHPLFCDALCMTLQAVTTIRKVDTATRLDSAVSLIDGGLKPDLVVMDLNLPDVDALDGLISLRRKAGVPVLVVSSMSDNRVIAGVLKAGAQGFVPKHSSREVIREAVQTIASGGVFVPDGFVEVAADAGVDTESALDRLRGLTNQQARILQLICEGKLNKQIAFDLSIAETTVKAHVTAIMRKLRVQSRTQAVLMAKKTAFSRLT